MTSSITPPEMLPAWIAERELTVNEVDVLKKLVAPEVLDVIESEGIDVLSHDGAVVVRAVSKAVAASLDFDDSMARGLSIAIDALAVERKFG